MMSNIFQIGLILLAVFCLVLYFYYDDKCDKSGGVLVKGVIGVACVYSPTGG